MTHNNKTILDFSELSFLGHSLGYFGLLIKDCQRDVQLTIIYQEKLQMITFKNLGQSDVWFNN